jgi:hypothetical protein
MAASARSSLDVDYVCVWQEEMGRAVRQSESLPPAAREAIAQLLQRFLEEDAADDQQDELREAITLISARGRPKP